MRMTLLKWIKLPILIGFLSAIIAQDVETSDNEIISERSSVLPYSDQPTTILFSKYREENDTILNNDTGIDDEESVSQEEKVDQYDVSYGFSYDTPTVDSEISQGKNATFSKPISNTVNVESTLNSKEITPNEVQGAKENDAAIQITKDIAEENGETNEKDKTLETENVENSSSVEEKKDTKAESEGSTDESIEEDQTAEVETSESILDVAAMKRNEAIKIQINSDPFAVVTEDFIGFSDNEEKFDDGDEFEAKSMPDTSTDDVITDSEEEESKLETESLTNDSMPDTTAEEIITDSAQEESKLETESPTNDSMPDTTAEEIITDSAQEESKLEIESPTNESMPDTSTDNVISDSEQEEPKLETESPTTPVIILGRSKFTDSPDETPSTAAITTSLPVANPEDMIESTESDPLIQRETLDSESTHSPELTDNGIPPVDPNSNVRSNFDNSYNQQYSTNDYYEENEYSMMPENCDPNDPRSPCAMETPKPIRNPVPNHQYPTESPYDEYGYNRYREYGAYHQSNDRRYNTASYDEFSSSIDVDNEKIQIEYKWPVSHQSPNFRQCHMALDPGNGPDEINTWYYDRQEGKCKWFAYGGYGGNANRFYSRGACIHLCIMNNDNPCLQSNIECWGSTKCESYRDKECIQYQESRNRNVDEICPPAQPVCMTKRKSRIQPKVDKTNIPLECSQKMDAGTCTDEKPLVRYYYDTHLQTCKSFYYFKSKTSDSNCGGNSNRFVTKDDCMNYCSP